MINKNNKPNKYKTFDAKKQKKKSKKKPRIVEGKISITKSGVGFVTPDMPDIENGNHDKSNDIFVGARHLKSAMNGDIVSVEILSSPSKEKRSEGRVKNVIKRAVTKVVGVYTDCGRFGVVTPLGKSSDDIFVPRKNRSNARHGDMVETTITKYPKGRKGPEGLVVRIIAHGTDPHSEVKAILKENDVNTEFSMAAVSEAKEVYVDGDISDEVLKEELKKRKDLRDLDIITIDGPHSKDLDDAISIEKNSKGNYILGVHIADVSHYVKEDSSLDQESFDRGNSIYLLDYVVPMLPKELSNGICSLSEGRNRLSLSCIMEVNNAGEVLNHEIAETVIRSKGRLVYDEVSDYLDFVIEQNNHNQQNNNQQDNNNQQNNHREQSKPNEQNNAVDVDADEMTSKCLNSNNYDKLAKHESTLKLMQELAVLLQEKRHQDGSLDFDLDEAEIEIDEEGIPSDVVSVDRRIANRMIEEFMLLANKTVAEEYFWMNYPFVYRIHEKPDPESIMKLKTFMAGLGIKLSVNPDNVHPKALSKILDKMQGDNRLPVVTAVMLRSMQKARYSTECTGHYGLAFKYYCHFTSPIRRYPDLLIHRIIKAHINKTLSSETLSHFSSIANKAAEQSSLTEIRAQKMERKIEKIKKAQYMENHLGEEFGGVISGVTPFGFYVQLENTIEGLVHISTLGGTFDFLENNFKLMSRYDSQSFSLGDSVKVEVAKADKISGLIDFNLVHQNDKMA